MNELLNGTPETSVPISGRVEWTPEMIGRFWDYYGARPELHNMYFSKWVGPALIAFVRRHLARLGEVADYGAGPGYLLEKIMPFSDRCWALDFSEDSLGYLSERYRKEPRFAGTRIIGDETRQTLRVDTVFCIETLEHLLAQQVDETLTFIRDLLRPSGHLIVTVPHDETLEMNDVFCPQCGSVFHRWQHMSSWTAPNLENLMNRHGFQTVFCGADDLGARQRDLSEGSGLGQQVKRTLLAIIDTRRHAETVWAWCKSLMGKSSRASCARLRT